jgi:hypothetical protein
MQVYNCSHNDGGAPEGGPQHHLQLTRTTEALLTGRTHSWASSRPCVNRLTCDVGMLCSIPTMRVG